MNETTHTDDPTEQFKAAVREGEYAEFPLDADGEYALITDIEGDGEFRPFVAATSAEALENPQDHEQYVDDMLVDLEFMRYEGVEYDRTNSRSEDLVIYHIDGAQFTGMRRATLSVESILEAAGVPRGAEIHGLNWLSDGLEIEYTTDE